MRFVIFLACLVATYADTLSWESMLKYYMYSLSTYCSSGQNLTTWTCPWCEYLPIPPVFDITIFETQGAGTEGTFGFVGLTDESILVAFRGTHTIANWILDAEFDQTNYTPVADALVHEGFYLAYQQVAATITPTVQALQAAFPELPVISTGHSLGGALAVLNAAGLVQAGVENVELWNFGQPRVGNIVFSKYIDKIINTVNRVVNMDDIVPHLPPAAFNYHHEATEIWFPTNHTTYVICDSSGEDPNCSDSVNPIFYSIPDHLDYLGYGGDGLHPPVRFKTNTSSLRTTYRDMITKMIAFFKSILNPQELKVYVATKRSIYWEGDTVEGAVTVVAPQCPYQAELIIKIIGKAKGYSERAEKRVNVSYLVTTVEHFQGDVIDKELTLPFRFSLPEVCPTSFLYTAPSFHDDFAKLFYTVEATVKPTKPMPPKKTTKDFCVCERVKQMAVPIRAHGVEVMQEENVLAIDAWIDRDIFFPGDNILLRLKINNTHLAFEASLDIALMQIVEYCTLGISSFPRPIHVVQVAVPAYYFGIKWIPIAVPLDAPLSSSLSGTKEGGIVSNYFLQIDLNIRKLTIPITIIAKQEISSLHSIPPLEGTLPRTILIRPPLQAMKDATKCNLCDTSFGILVLKAHCYHCGKVFCKDCVPCITPIPNLKITDTVRACRPCMRTVAETGGVKHQTPKRVMEEWRNQQTTSWHPRFSKKDFRWISTKTYDPYTACYKAVA